MPVSVSGSWTKRPRISRGTVRKRGERMLAALDLRHAELSILLCGDARMRELNRRHRKRDRPTDVLAFAMSEGPALLSPLPGVLGDVVISLPTAARQARAANKDALDEVTMLLAHGLLHLLGFDHATPAQERRMRALTDQLVLSASGAVADPAVDNRGIKFPRKLRRHLGSPRVRAARS